MNWQPEGEPPAAPDVLNSDVARTAFNRKAAFRSIGFSLLVNALCPYLLFRFLEPRFPHESVLPLLYSTIFPVIGFCLGIFRKRMVDAIALIALCGIVFHIAVTVLSPNVSTALVLRSFEGTIVGLSFLASVAIGRPAILYIARQFVTAGAPERRARFDSVVAMDKGRVFRVATIVWGCGLALMSTVHVTLAIYLPHAEFLLVSPALGLIANGLLLGWSARYIGGRMSFYLQPAG
ncbi:MAG TPA: VC0807 family protein [Rhizomicrobium sp.]|nr:VC0807 family protein [Rhizomicrobium sp.]